MVPAKAGNGNGWRNYVITALISMVVTGAVSWFALFGRLTSETQVRAMIQRESPYVADRQMIQSLGITVRELSQTVAQLTVQINVLNDRLERP